MKFLEGSVAGVTFEICMCTSVCMLECVRFRCVECQMNINDDG